MAIRPHDFWLLYIYISPCATRIDVLDGDSRQDELIHDMPLRHGGVSASVQFIQIGGSFRFRVLD